jgi:hypothetical protein
MKLQYLLFALLALGLALSLKGDFELGLLDNAGTVKIRELLEMD